MSYGLFDVLGPVMHGPSSNHTGGANRIGYLARMIMGETPDRVELGFHPAYMNSYAGQRSHTALIAGCLGLREYDEDCMDSLQIAKRRGLIWSAAPIPETEKSRNTMRVTGWAGENQYVVNGDSIGGGNIVIDAINGLPVHLTGNEYLLILISPERELLEEAQRQLTGALESACKDAVSGRALGQNCLGCIVSASPFPEEALLPEALRAAVEKGVLIYRRIFPLYEFSDQGREPLFTTFSELIALGRSRDACEIAIEYECRRSGVSAEKVLSYGKYLVAVIESALQKGENEGFTLIGGLTDPSDGAKFLAWSHSGNTVVNEMFARGLARATLLAQMNASSCRIVAAPTGGSAGALPGALFSAAERYQKNEEELAKAFLVAAAIGVIIGNKASFSGTVGGCQSEVGVGAAMGAGAIAYMAGATMEQIVQSAAIALKNVLGLTCDPPAPPTEVPCIKRNAMGVAVAFFGAEMGLAGLRSAIDPDDVVTALADTQRRLPMELKFSHIGGLADTPSGKRLREEWEEKLANMNG